MVTATPRQAVWTNLIKRRPAAKLTIDLNLRAVFSHQRAMPLKRLSRPTPCSLRERALQRAEDVDIYLLCQKARL
jgi:hypothetical protein